MMGDRDSVIEEDQPGSPFAYNLQNLEAEQSPPSAAEQAGGRTTAKTTTKVNRRINTCQPCQQAKRACDRQRPCKACTERKTTDRCKYASDAAEPVDSRWLHKKLMMQDNFITALCNTLNITSEQRESVASAEDGASTLKFDISKLLTVATPPQPPGDGSDAATRQYARRGPKSHMTVYSLPPQHVPFDEASKVFGSNSLFVNMEDLLGPWSETLGLHMRAYPVHDRKTLEDSAATETSYVHLAAAHSELENRNWKGSKNLQALRTAFELFVSPLSSSDPQYGDGYSSLIMPWHVAKLPPAPLRDELWAEFESMMILHRGLVTPELKKRVDNMFLWAEWDSRASLEHTRPPAPTLSFYAVVASALAIGAQSRECKIAHQAAASASDSPEMAHSASALFQSPIEPPNPWSQFDGHGLKPFVTSAQDLHDLSEAARLAHDQLNLPPNLDYILTHVLSWLYLLHPANVESFMSDSAGGIAGGGPIGIDSRVWKEVGKIVNVARSMGLGIDPDSPMVGDELHNMSPWQKEMRRRTWWELCYYDMYVSECMGQYPLIDPVLYDCALPSDADESSFTNASEAIPPPSGSTIEHNLTHFVYKCRLVKLCQEMKRYPTDTRSQLELSIDAARAFEKEILLWKASLPSYLTISGLPNSSDTSWNNSVPIDYPPSDMSTMQACHLYTMANAVIVRLWTPFLFPTLEMSKHQTWPAFACTTAASAVLIASNHVRVRFRDVRPANLGYFFIGRSIFIAGCMSATVAILGGPDVHFAENALKNIRTAIEISKDTTVCGVGRPDPKTYRFESGRVLDLLYIKAENCFKRNQANVGAKRKETTEGHPQHEVLKLRAGYELPYLGKGVVTTSCTLQLNYGPYKPFKEVKQQPKITERLTDAALSGDEMVSPRPATNRHHRPPPSWQTNRPSATSAFGRSSESEEDGGRRVRSKPTISVRTKRRQTESSKNDVPASPTSSVTFPASMPRGNSIEPVRKEAVQRRPPPAPEGGFQNVMKKRPNSLGGRPGVPMSPNVSWQSTGSMEAQAAELYHNYSSSESDVTSLQSVGRSIPSRQNRAEPLLFTNDDGSIPGMSVASPEYTNPYAPIIAPQPPMEDATMEAANAMGFVTKDPTAIIDAQPFPNNRWASSFVQPQIGDIPDAATGFSSYVQQTDAQQVRARGGSFGHGEYPPFGGMTGGAMPMTAPQGPAPPMPHHPHHQRYQAASGGSFGEMAVAGQGGWTEYAHASGGESSDYLPLQPGFGSQGWSNGGR